MLLRTWSAEMGFVVIYNSEGGGVLKDFSVFERASGPGGGGENRFLLQT